MDNILNKENTGVYLPPNPIKNGVPLSNTVLKQTVKKSVLGKLDNNLLKTPSITPFKADSVKLEGSIAKLSIRKGLKQNLINREEISVNARNCYLGGYKLKAKTSITNLFDYTDLPNRQCLKKCSRPIQEIWSDNQCGYDALFEKLSFDFRSLENDFGENYEPPMEPEVDVLPSITATENVGATDCEFKLNLMLPIPNFESVQILF
ncbi:uncharacterized protein Dana_GF15772 [Drosophila ananassae]|uniref:Uncharacterized protein n=1 Tax=Drosophila ananassae TaxID=7217 RepID=B3MPS5_DROAN|nr:uncharacterized protein LOC6498577 [Drosophila ananassae]EDV32323.1 uncharacterized protein Dana_GF15772 [Drosophila ananassae]